MSLSLHQLPSLDLLRSFVAVGRRLSVTLAAEDLCLTQSAVSRQVQALERHLGTPLFVRGHRSVTFTAAGERLFLTADAAVQQLLDTTGALRADSRMRPVTISANVGTITLWLLPRLSALQRLHPGLDVRVAASHRLADLPDDGADLAIRDLDDTQAPAGAVRLFGETLSPVAHPSLVTEPWRNAAALRRVVLLELHEPRDPWLRWADWLAARGWADAVPADTLHFDHYDLTIQAALAGQGVALGRLAFLREHLASGRLVRVDPDVVLMPTRAHWLLQADDSPRAEVQRVAEWIAAEAAATEA